jgi:hypothetical protein
MATQIWQSSVDGSLFSTEEECIAHEESHLASSAVPRLVKECGDLFFKGEDQESLCSEYFKTRLMREMLVMPRDLWAARDEMLILSDIATYLRDVSNVSTAFGKSFLAGKCSGFTIFDLIKAADDFAIISAALENVMRCEHVPFLPWTNCEVRQLYLHHDRHDMSMTQEQAQEYQEYVDKHEVARLEIEEEEASSMREELRRLSDPFEGSPY